MAPPSALLDYLVDQLAPLGQIRGRAMFGAHGVYLNGLFIGIIDDETLYLKVDEANRPAYAAAGMEPFVYQSRGRAVTLSFWQAPAEVLEEPETLCHWVAEAAAAAGRARSAGGPGSRAKPAARRPKRRRAGDR
jgi:DNA transformation protein and related proteins